MYLVRWISFDFWIPLFSAINPFLYYNKFTNSLAFLYASNVCFALMKNKDNETGMHIISKHHVCLSHTIDVVIYIKKRSEILSSPTFMVSHKWMNDTSIDQENNLTLCHVTYIHSTNLIVASNYYWIDDDIRTNI